MAIPLPDFLTSGWDSDSVLARMKANLLAAVAARGKTIDVAEGSMPHDALAPASIEIALAAIFAQQVLQRVFVNAEGAILDGYLDLRVSDVGEERLGATKAGLTLSIGGTNGTLVPTGSQFSTVATTQQPAQVFVTDADVVIGSGVAVVTATALLEGAAGNVAIGTVTLMVNRIDGVTSVINTTAGIGGADAESSDNLLSRFNALVSAPRDGGRPADYINWSREVVGVGGAATVLERDGPGTVPIALIGTDYLPATQVVVDAVLDHILYPWRQPYEAESFVVALSNGVTIDTTLTDDVGNSTLMQYSVAGVGRITQALSLPESGIWVARVRVKVDSAAGANNLLEFGVWNLTTNAWAVTAPTVVTQAVVTRRPNQLSTLFAWYDTDFYWNGTDSLQLRVTRLQTDTTTKLWIDQAYLRSAFQANDGSGLGLSPAGARVSTEAAAAVSVNLAATLTVKAGYDVTTVRNAVTTAFQNYLKALAFAPDNDVHYVKVGSLILDTDGVALYSGLLLNGGATDVVVGPQQIATVGTVTLT